MHIHIIKIPSQKKKKKKKNLKRDILRNLLLEKS